jgi:RNAse (barnase) inhibitor barstar
VPQLVRRLEFPCEPQLRTEAGEDLDLRWDPDTGTIELGITVSGEETVLSLSRETLRSLIMLAQDVEAELGDAEVSDETS